MAASEDADRAHVTAQAEKPTSRAHWTAIAVGVFLLLVGVFAFVVGFHDATLRDEPASVIVVGAMLAVAGLVAVGAGIAVLLFATNHATVELWSGRLVLAACAIVAVAAGYFVVASARSVETNRVLMALGVIVILLAVGSFVFFERASGVTLGKVGVFVLGAFGAAFGVFQFWYQQEYVPTHAPAALSLTAKLEPAGTRGGRELYAATVSIKNVGTGKVIAFTGTYLVSGVNFETVSSEPTEARIAEPLKSPGTNPYSNRFSRHYVQSGFTPVTGGKLFADNRYFEPGEELTREYVVAVPACRYALLSLRTNAAVAKGELLRPADTPSTRHEFFQKTASTDDGKEVIERAYVYAEWHLLDDSWVHDMVDGKERRIQIVWDHPPYGWESAYYTPSVWLRSGAAVPEIDSVADVERLTKRAQKGLGLASTFSDFEIAIPAPEPAAGAKTSSCDT